MMTEPPEGAPVERTEALDVTAGLPIPEEQSAQAERDDDGRVIAGVAFELAARIGIDPLWVRLAFVGLALASGLGVLVYLGLWLLVIVGARPGWAALRWIGAGVLGLGALLLLDGRTDMIDGPFALAAVL